MNNFGMKSYTMIPHLVVLSPSSVSVNDSNADSVLLNTVCNLLRE